MFEIEQGDILSVEKIPSPVLVVSTNFFNKNEQLIGVPISQSANPDPLHIPIRTQNLQGIVLCEQMRYLDLRAREYKKIGDLPVGDVMNITDAIQGIFDYIR